MGGSWLVAGSLGVLVAGYAGDRLLWTASMTLGADPSLDVVRGQALALALLLRLLVLGWLVAVLVAVRGGTLPRVSAVVAGIGAVVGIAPPLLLGLHFALPDGFDWLWVDEASDPLWGGRSAFTPWVPIGLLVIGLIGIVASRGLRIGPRIGGVSLAIGAVLLVAAAYVMDALWEASAIEVAYGLEAYPAFAVIGLGMRVVVMVAFAVLLASVVRATGRGAEAFALLAVGIMGFVVLPIVGLLASPSPFVGTTTLAAELDPRTAARWMAGAVLVAGIVALLRPRAEATADNRGAVHVREHPEPV